MDREVNCFVDFDRDAYKKGYLARLHKIRRKRSHPYSDKIEPFSAMTVRRGWWRAVQRLSSIRNQWDGMLLALAATLSAWLSSISSNRSSPTSSAK
jgi:hypothetical protein